VGDGRAGRDFDCGIDGAEIKFRIFFACFLYPCFDKIFVSVGVPSMGCQDPWFRMSVGTKNTSNPGWLEGGEYKE